jgi:hypothetical protein
MTPFTYYLGRVADESFTTPAFTIPTGSTCVLIQKDETDYLTETGLTSSTLSSFTNNV